MTPEQRAKYVDNPNHCPACQKVSTMEAQDSTHDDRFHWFDLKCGVCDATWTEVYVLSDVYFTNKEND